MSVLFPREPITNLRGEPMDNTLGHYKPQNPRRRMESEARRAEGKARRKQRAAATGWMDIPRGIAKPDPKKIQRVGRQKRNPRVEMLHKARFNPFG